MGSLKEQILEALDYLPESRSRNSRQRNLHLDDLIDTSARPLSGGARDFIYTAYRYLPAFDLQSKKFFRKKVKSAPFQDLALLAYSSLLSRDKTAPEVLGSEVIEAAKSKVPKPLIGTLNAFCRWCASQKGSLLQDLKSSPAQILGPRFRERWKGQAELLQKVGHDLLSRPEPGIWCFDENLCYELKSAADFFKSTHPLQAMNPGSHLWMQEVDKATADQKITRVLDACSAPGAKLLWTLVSARKSGQKIQSVAIEEKFQRMERLKENLRKFGLLEQTKTLLLSLGKDPLPTEVVQQEWSLITADLPCSGSGTLFSRPDLLWNESLDRVPELEKIQRGILETLLALNFKTLAVSVCSVDPVEVGSLAKILGTAPAFESWRKEAPLGTDGITGWIIKK